MRKALSMLALLLLTTPIVAQDKERPIVHLPEGLVQARMMESHGGQPYLGFQGIPYAAPPVGDLRWMPPQPSGGWEGVLDGSLSPTMCVQGVPDVDTFTADNQEERVTVGGAAYMGYEDCLVLHVYTTHLNHNASLPVLVWFHGGGLASGMGGMYQPGFLMDYGVVVVTVNYRLGPWGELSLDSGEVSGNQGLRDQVLALSWVQSNIHLFGGDKDSVTIAGESAGSWSVFHHLLSPPSSGLFRAGIASSGTMISALADRFMTREEAAANGREFAIIGGCHSDGAAWQPQLVLACLRNKTAEQLFSAYSTGTFRSRGNVDFFSSHPPILPDLPETLLAAGEFNKVPILVGSNSGEGVLNSGRYILRPELLEEDFADPAFWDEEMGPYYIFDRIPALNRTDYGKCDVQVSAAARQFYFKDNITADDLQQFINLNSDVQFFYGTEKMIEYLVPHSPVFHYILYFQDLFSITINPNTLGRNLGVCHSDDIFYLWDMYGLNAETGVVDAWWSEDNKLNSRRMLEMWTNFVKYLDPTPGLEDSENLGETKWRQVTLEKHTYLRIDSELVMEMTEEYRERMDFWHRALAACQ